MEKDYITGRGRQKKRVRARDLLCYWTVFELGIPIVDLARKFDIAPTAVSYTVQQEEKMAKEQGFQLKLELFEYLSSSPFPLYIFPKKGALPAWRAANA